MAGHLMQLLSPKLMLEPLAKPAEQSPPKPRASCHFLPAQRFLPVIAVIVVSECLINYNSKRALL